jgi:hypothetical protein
MQLDYQAYIALGFLAATVGVTVGLFWFLLHKLK